jgi:(E)-4-hydroxy-3-methylbut-2-enyl-diphosphate synthase
MPARPRTATNPVMGAAIAAIEVGGRVVVESYQSLEDRIVKRAFAAAARTDVPLHLGVTEAGTPKQGIVKSAIGIGTLLAEGIGDTIRVSLSADPVEEVKAGIAILESLHLRERGLDVVSCPSCGRAQVDVYTLAEKVTAGLEGLTVPLRVAVMGCVVNGPGEAKDSDVGVAAGRGKGVIFRKGKILRRVMENEIVPALKEEINSILQEDEEFAEWREN